jgi:hypothetical protein
MIAAVLAEAAGPAEAVRIHRRVCAAITASYVSDTQVSDGWSGHPPVKPRDAASGRLPARQEATPHATLD